MEFNFRDLAAAALAQNRIDAAGLLDWRQRVIAATAARESDVSFIVPPDVLPGMTEVGGSRVVHSADVDRPGVILPMPEF